MPPRTPVRSLHDAPRTIELLTMLVLAVGGVGLLLSSFRDLSAARS